MEKTKGAVDNLLGGLPELSPKAALSPAVRHLTPPPHPVPSNRSDRTGGGKAQGRRAEAGCGGGGRRLRRRDGAGRDESKGGGGGAAGDGEAQDRGRGGGVCALRGPSLPSQRPASANRPRHTPTGTGRGRACRRPRGASGSGALFTLSELLRQRSHLGAQATRQARAPGAGRPSARRSRTSSLSCPTSSSLRSSCWCVPAAFSRNP